LMERLPYLEARFVPAGSLQPDAQKPSQDTVMLTTLASVVVREDLHPMIKRVLADIATKLHRGSGPMHRADEFPHLKRVEFSSAKEARNVLRHGMPWIEASLGIRWAPWLYRFLFIGLPLIVVALTLSQMIPAYLRWLMESAINRWYGELKYIENDLKSTHPIGLEMVRFRDKLKNIDERVTRFKAPHHFMQRMYVLQRHVKFVSAQLKSSHGR
jgi:uncharacterized protein